MKKYKTILADPPWQQVTGKTGYTKTRPNRPQRLPYSTMSFGEIKGLSINKYADIGCHLWLWVTNSYLKEGFEVMKAWGFKYFIPITWIKPSGCGNWFVHRTQHILFGYKERLVLKKKYQPNVIFAPSRKHSQKPEESYQLIEAVGYSPRLELFARPVSPMFPKRKGWDVWGNEVESDIKLELKK